MYSSVENVDIWKPGFAVCHALASVKTIPKFSKSKFSIPVSCVSVVLLTRPLFCVVLFVCSVSWLFLLPVQVTDWKYSYPK